MKLEVRLLGDVALLADGQSLDLGGTRQRSVFALLVLQRNRAIGTEQLADRLWPDEQPLTALKTIQVYVSRLRRTLGSEAGLLTSSATGYRLAIADDELDAARFERGLRLAREALGSGPPSTAAALLHDALGQWAGSALGDLAGEPFARREAERLEELRLQAMEELHELQIAAGSGREAIGELRRLVADWPGRERLWRLLMLALYGDGRQGEALQAYQDARRYLGEELGLDPSPELQELERAILTQEAPRTSQARPHLAGRADEANAPTTDLVQSTEDAGVIARRSRRIVTVLRADVVQPSDASDPEVLEARGRQAYEVVRHAVERHGGTIDRTDPDGVTAVFGLTVAREDDPVRAIRAAFELKMGAEAGADAGGVTLQMGVATGEVLAEPKAPHGSRLAGAPSQAAASLAARAEPNEILMATETERLVRGATTTEKIPPGQDGADSTPSAVRLLALTGGDAIPRRTTTRFVGRGAELDALLTAFEHVVSAGAPGLATVIGAPGVGKSRLVAEAFARISERARILRSRCLPYGDGITYWPVRELVLAAAGIGPGQPRDAALARLDAIVAGLDRRDVVRRGVASVIGLADDPVPSEELPWAVRRFFEALAAEQPLVLLVDDLQWAEPALVQLLEHVLDLGRGPLLLVTVARPELEETSPDWLARSRLGFLRLESLADSDAAALLDHLAPELPPGELRARILATVEGNPLFVEQFVAYVADELAKDGRTLDGPTAAHLPIPPTIGALLAARLDRLPDAERRLLERAAVVGRTFSAGALTELLPEIDASELPTRLAGLTRRDLIRPDRSDMPDDEAFRFRHLLIRDAAYAALPKSERAELHERFADWLERRSASDPGAYDLIVGYHLEQAHRYLIELGGDHSHARRMADRALRFIAPAGQAAEQRSDPHAAVSLLGRAVNLSEPGRERIELLVSLRDALRTAGESDRAEAVDADIDALLTEHPDEELELRARLTDARFKMVLGGSIKVAQDALAYYEGAGDKLGMIQALDVAVVYHHAVRCQYTIAMAELDRATTLARECGRPDLVAKFVAYAAVALDNCPVPIPEALDRCWRSIDQIGDNRAHRASILRTIGQLEARTGINDRWRRHFDEASAIAQDLGLMMPFGIALIPIALGETELAAGEPTRTVDLLRECCATLVRVGDLPNFLSTLAPLTAQTLLAVGRFDEVEHYAFWGRDLTDPEDLDAQARWRFAVSGLRSHQGRHEEAIALARESVSIMAGTEFVETLSRAQETLAGAFRAAGDEAGALAAAHEVHAIASARQDRAVLRTIEAFLAGGD